MEVMEVKVEVGLVDMVGMEGMVGLVGQADTVTEEVASMIAMITKIRRKNTPTMHIIIAMSTMPTETIVTTNQLWISIKTLATIQKVDPAAKIL